jgi:predicted SnoaL-like aldol condensation-catalyzing enzyme
MSTLEANKTIVRRFVEEVWGQWDLNHIDELVAFNFVMHDNPYPEPLPGPNGVRKAITAEKAAFPGATFEVEDMIAEGDKVACCTSETFSEGGKRTTLRGMNIFRILDGKITEEWWVYDPSEKWWLHGPYGKDPED